MTSMGDYASRGYLNVCTPAQALRNALDRIWFVERERSGP